MTVRRYAAPDEGFVQSLGVDTAPSSLSLARPAPPDTAADSFTRLFRFCTERAGTVIFIAEYASLRTGFLIMLTDVPDDVTGRDQAFIAYMGVEPAARRKGVARALLLEAEQEARRRKLPHLSLMVSADNAAARGLYDGVGFIEERMLLTKPVDQSGG